MENGAMGLSRRTFTKEFREEAVRRLELGASVAEVARACEVNPNVLHRWRRELRDYGAKAFSGNGQRRGEEQQVAEVERKVGRQALEIDFLPRCLQHVEEQGKLQALTTRGSSISEVKATNNRLVPASSVRRQTLAESASFCQRT